MDNKTQPSNLHSAGFDFEPALGQVSINGASFRISPVNMKVLVALLINAGQVLSRQQLFDAVWGQQVVSDDTLTRAISDLRQLLGQHSSEPLIQTIPKRGYRWLGKLEPTDSKPHAKAQHQLSGAKTHREVTVEQDQSKTETTQQKVVRLVGSFLIALLLSFIAGSYLSNKTFGLNITKVAVIANATQNSKTVEAQIKAFLLKSEHVGYVSSKVLGLAPVYRSLSNEYGVRWIVEIDALGTAPNDRVVVNLVDAKTALVEDSVIVESNNLENPMTLTAFLQQLELRAR
ncbi:MAG: winged helix-turn-helix domain-containing protein [Kangiellaceae bacterium]|jgi:DNA-binding winged helix-turn-helix (wHTH) protein|nr:winged helix-turn-helix domain-containing protein [Kangiellaceae bacterium]